MQGLHFQSRSNWREQAQVLGFNVALLENPAYWVEALDKPFCLQFTLDEIKAIARASQEINELALAMVAHVCQAPNSDELMAKLRIPPAFRPAVRLSWQRHDRSLYGRLDLAVVGNRIKLFELNFDTPTSLPETAVLQMAWYQALSEGSKSGKGGKNSFAIEDASIEQSDQFNFIQENLLEALSPALWSADYTGSSKGIHFAYYRHADEDAETVKYLYGCSQLAGLDSKLMVLNDLKCSADGAIYDAEGLPVHTLFKLYPWEQIFKDEERLNQEGKSLFLPLVLNNQTAFVEPLWKALLSSKACLALLWQMYPEHPLLLETYFEDDSAALQLRQSPHVRKPLFGREGANIEIVFPQESSQDEKSGGEFSEDEFSKDEYSKDGFIVQAYEPMPRFEDYNLLVGSWLVNNRAVGLGIRADRSKITGRRALFVPHFVA